MIDNEVQDVPLILEPIYRTEGWILGLLLFLSFLMIALAKRLEPNILSIVGKSFFTLGTPASLDRFEVRFSTTAFIFLGLNFLNSLLVCTTLFIQDIAIFPKFNLQLFGYDMDGFQLSITSLLIVLGLVVYNFLGLFFINMVTGEKNTLGNFVSQSWANLLFYGLTFFALGVIWLLNPTVSELMLQVFIYLFIAFYITRLSKMLIASILEGVAWYYIILYLCTLEILPLLVIYHYVG